MGFRTIPYYRCVANMMIEGKQCTITWYADDNQIQHISVKVVTMMLKKITEHFGELLVSRGNKHDLLGMRTILNRKEKQVVTEMIDQCNEAIEMFANVVYDTVTSPAVKKSYGGRTGVSTI